MARDAGTGGSGTGRAFRSALVTIGLGTVLAVVVGLVVGLVQGDVPRGLASWGSPVFFVAVVVAVYLAYRSGERRR
ncbi:hypothetical protein FHN55_13610 [Streptomyces sp. NP160]|uniref:hypothetical protein n=1 Tax=Streptomyces sp. NP160 TaxID=2586637 RepID=UPI00111892DF|nr:hypothetical protein [Streptomyces sp. NP160]TNM64553.1 hypothetical protein FHN55_13610 [Streptomyces sp. NP160]